MAKEPHVQKSLWLTQAKIDRARGILGAQSDADAVETALDLVARQAVPIAVEIEAPSPAVGVSSAPPAPSAPSAPSEPA